MKTAIQILLIITVVISAAQMGDQLCDLLFPQETSFPSMDGKNSIKRSLVFWVLGLGFLGGGIFSQIKRFSFFPGLVIAGGYFLILGAHGGIFSSQNHALRLLLSALNLTLFLFLAYIHAQSNWRLKTKD